MPDNTLYNPHVGQDPGELRDATQRGLTEAGIRVGFKNKPGEKYENEGVGWFKEKRTGASIDGFVRREAAAVRDLRVVDIFPGVKPKNPLPILNEQRPGFAPQMADLASKNQSVEIKESLKTFFQDYCKRDLDSKKADAQIEEIKKKTMNNPSQAMINTGARQELEKVVLRGASNDLRNAHRDMVTQYLEHAKKDPAVMASIKKEADSKKLSPEKFVEKLLQPAIKFERAALDQINAEVRQDFAKKPREALQWARICAMQDPEVYELAKQKYQERQDKADQVKIKIDNNPDPAKPNENASDQANKNDPTKPLSVSIGAAPPLQATISEGVQPLKIADEPEENDIKGLPALGDFMAALEEMPHKRFQFTETKPGFIYGNTKQVTSKLYFGDGNKNIQGMLYCSFGEMLPDAVRQSKKVFDTMMNMVETVWLNQKDNDVPTIMIDASDASYLEVQIRAALYCGFKLENISATLTNASVQNKPFPINATTIPNLPKIQDEVQKYKEFDSHQEEAAVAKAISSVPADRLSINEGDDLDKNFTAYENDYHEEREILEEVKQSLEEFDEENPDSAKRVEVAIDRLNLIAQAPAKSSSLLETARWAGAKAVRVGGTVAGVAASMTTGVPGLPLVGGIVGSQAGKVIDNKFKNEPGALSGKDLVKPENEAIRMAVIKATEAKLGSLDKAYVASKNEVSKATNTRNQSFSM